MIYKATSVAGEATTDTTDATSMNSYSASAVATTSFATSANQYSFTPAQTTTVLQSSTALSTQKSHAWIAGPVIGAFVGCAILIGLAIWIWSLYRRLAKTKQSVQDIDSSTEKPPEIQQPIDNNTATHHPGPQELAADRAVELPATHLRSELAAT